MKLTAGVFLFLCGLQAALAEPFTTHKVVHSRVKSELVSFRVVQIVADLNFPWALEFLSADQLLITERSGRLWLMEDQSLHEVSGVPEVRVVGQGGLLDVIKHPEFLDNGVIYLSYAADYRNGVGTRVARAVLDGYELRDLKVIFEMDPPGKGPVHFGSRFAFDADGYLFVTLGERGDRDLAQRLDAHRGKVIRLHDDGRVPVDNPFANQSNAYPEVFSYGHRNPQGIVFDPVTGLLWTHEHGPRGGDALNIIRPGKNYGWPLATHGREYHGPKIGSTPEELDYIVDPVIHWTPSIAPCGLTQHRGGNFPEWEGNLFAGALVLQHIRRIVLDGETVTHQEVLLQDRMGRIREIVHGPDGNIWFATDADHGGIFRLERAD